MGVSLEVYRCRVGLFHLKSRQKSSLSTDNILILHHDIISLLLLIAGVEPNPGPPFGCKYCNYTCRTVPSYFHHLKVHASLKKFATPCCVKNCGRVFKNLTTLQCHISRYHRRVPTNEPSPVVGGCVVCSIPVCKANLMNRKSYLKHMKDHIIDGELVTCPMPNCDKSFNNTSKFGVYTSRYHPGEFCNATETDPIPSSNIQSEVDSHHNDNENYIFGFDVQEDSPSDDNIFPEYLIKDELARFYLKLEGELLLPTKTVQLIADKIKFISELIHHSLKRVMKKELKTSGADDKFVEDILSKCFKHDPVFNTHHKHEDIEQLSTHWLREKYWGQRFPYVKPKEIYLGSNEAGKKKFAHQVPIRDTLTVMLRDERVKDLVRESFKPRIQDSILRDFTDGSGFASHKYDHNGQKCLQLLFFQDAFDFNAFGPSKGVYKPVGFYYTLGNLPPEYRSKVDQIMLSYMILERYLLHESKAEQLSDSHDKMKEALQPFLDDLKDLKLNGIEFDGERIPVCLLYLLGDNLGQHQVGGFVRSFVGQFFCRFCTITKDIFHNNPWEIRPLRTPQEYDEAVVTAKRRWSFDKLKAITAAKRKIRMEAQKTRERLASRTSAPASPAIILKAISENALLKLKAVHFKGVKYRPSPFNSEDLKFHVSAPAQPPCLGRWSKVEMVEIYLIFVSDQYPDGSVSYISAHDLFEGSVKVIVARVLKYCICEKQWFDLACLNKRIQTFKCKGSDADDPPKPLKKLDELSGNAVQNWNFLRLLPLIIGDLIIEPQDDVWQLYLLLKTICELVCAPSITLKQVAYLKSIIQLFVSNLKLLLEHFPHCLIPKVHYLVHYPDLIEIFGPLIRLFTLRYESKHMFFKKVMKNTNCYINVTKTLTSKYVSSFAFTHTSGIIPPDIECESRKTRQISMEELSEKEKEAFSSDFCFYDFESVLSVKVKGIPYNLNSIIILDQLENLDLKVALIQKILISSANNVYFLCEEATGINSFQGFYYINSTKKKYSLCQINDFSDYYPLSTYHFQGSTCFVLKHSSPCMN